MNKYEKTIGLKTIFLTFARRWRVIFIIFIPSIIVTLLVSLVFIPKQYQSSVTLFNGSSLNTTTHNAVQLQIQQDSTLKKATQYLETDYSLSITNETILKGLSFTAFNSSTPNVVKFSFTSKTQNIVKPIIESLSKAALEELIANGYEQMKISSSASNPVSVGKGKTYLLIGLAASVVLGLGIAFVDEIVSDEVYDEDDLALLGSSSYGLIVTKK